MDDKEFIALIRNCAIALILIIGLWLWIGPQYNVWSKGKNGEALLLEADSTRQVRVAEAKARLDASKLEAEAEIVRAKGQAVANTELAKTLTPEVLQYQYIRVLEEQGAQGDRTVIYIPTDPRTGLPVNLPVPEANRFK